MASRSAPHRILRLRVSLVGSKPEIWRTVDVDDALTLAQVHDVLQAALGWQDSHLHRFTDSDPFARSRGIPRIGRAPRAWVDAWSLGEAYIEGEEDEAHTTIAEAMQFDGPLWYEYDMGDSWVHAIELIERRDAEPDERIAAVVRGEGRAPFEDSGGMGGYEEKLAIIADPEHPEHNEVTAWARFVVGPWGSIDPDDAELSGAQAELDARFGPASAEIAGIAGIASDSPLADLAAALPVPYRVNLRRHLGVIAFDLPIRPLADEAAELVRPYRWLLARVGSEGITLTKAGWMPPAVVREGVVELEWADRWFGAANREEHTKPMHDLRLSAERMRLIRKVKGRLEPIARIRKIADDPEALCTEVARMLLRQRMNDVERMAGTLLVLGLADGTISTHADAERAVLDVLNGCGYRDPDGGPLGSRWFYWLTEPVREALYTLGLWPARGPRKEPPSITMQRFARLALR